jgi:hypothetical protein
MAFLKGRLRFLISSCLPTPSLLTSAEKLQYEGYVRREETNAAILSLKAQGIAVKEIVRRTGYSRGLIRKILSGSALRCSFVSDKVPLIPTFPGSTSNGKPGVAMERPCGGRSGCADFEAAFAL